MQQLLHSYRSLALPAQHAAGGRRSCREWALRTLASYSYGRGGGAGAARQGGGRAGSSRYNDSDSSWQLERTSSSEERYGSSSSAGRYGGGSSSHRGAGGRGSQRPGGWQRSGGRSSSGRGGRGGGSREEWDAGDQGLGSSTLAALKEGLLGGDILYGVAPVLAALKCGRRQLHCLYLQEGMDAKARKDKSALDQAVRAAEAAGARVQRGVSKHDLNMLTGSRPHQGLVLDCSPLEFVEIEELPDPHQVQGDAPPPCWLALDEVVDPQNFGAAVRSALFLGAAGVLTCARNSAPLTGVVSKASAGALEAMPIHSARNLPRTLAAASVTGWQVVGAAAGPTSVSCASFKVTRPTILVMGSEGAGLRTNVERCCDLLLRIDGPPAASQHAAAAGLAVPVIGDVLDSLNVSVATGILLHQLISSAGGQQHSSSGADAGAAQEGAPGAAAAAAGPGHETAVQQQQQPELPASRW